jgi:threonine synthase
MDTDPALLAAASDYGAQVHRIEGFISDCGREASKWRERGAWDLSTLKEPYRLEGKKTMGYELWEEGPLPDVIVYPTGGGTGLVGMWKAFAELRKARLLEGPLPRMVSVQMAGCAPVCRAFAEGQAVATPWEQPATDVLGLRVPSAVGDVLILSALRESRGTAVTVTEEEAFASTQELNDAFVIDAAPEAGAAFAGLTQLSRSGLLRSSDKVCVFLTGSGELYRDLLARHGVKPGVVRTGTS